MGCATLRLAELSRSGHSLTLPDSLTGCWGGGHPRHGSVMAVGPGGRAGGLVVVVVVLWWACRFVLAFWTF
jgi:hypothetical protein